MLLLVAALQLVFGWTKSLPVSVGRPGLRILTHGIETVVLTLGAEGCRVIGPEGDFRVPAAPRQVVNTVGAGDAFTAAYILSRLAGRDALACAQEANRVGGYVTTQDSGTPELPEEYRIF